MDKTTEELREEIIRKFHLSRVDIEALGYEELVNLKNSLGGGGFSSEDDNTLRLYMPNISKDSGEDDGLHHLQGSVDTGRVSHGFDASMSSAGAYNYMANTLKKDNPMVTSMGSVTSGGGSILPKFPKSANNFAAAKLTNAKSKIQEKLSSMRDNSFFKKSSPEHKKSGSVSKKTGVSSNNLTKVPQLNSKVPPPKKQVDPIFNLSKLFISEDEYYTLRNKNQDLLKNHEIVTNTFF